MNWFDVDKAGLAQLLERKGKAFAVYELVQNCWDENTTHVSVKLKRIAGSPYVTLSVVDDNPSGFADLTHAFTLFAASNKKGNAEKRGRFNLGEKLVLALCREAYIRSTKGAVYFDKDGRRSSKTNCRDYGTEFVGQIKMTDAEIEECYEAMSLLISPDHIETYYEIGTFSGTALPLIVPVVTFEEPLPTEIADAEGNMRRSTRRTKVTLHRTHKTQAYLYEMGIPVVEIDGPFHVNVHQKVPLNFDRDNVTPAYLAKVYALAVENTKDRLTEADVNQTWVKIAVQEGGDDLSNEAIRRIADLRFGERRVAYDPSDVEANNIAVSKGYQVVHGGNLSGAEWGLMKRANAILPAGQVTPSRRDGTVPLITIPVRDWTGPMARVADFCRAAAPHLIDVPVTVSFSNNPTVSEIATYGNRTINFNVGRLGYRWFNGPAVTIITLVIHEFAHEKSGNHLSEQYYDALTEIGAKMTMLALNNRGVLELLDDVAELEDVG